MQVGRHDGQTALMIRRRMARALRDIHKAVCRQKCKTLRYLPTAPVQREGDPATMSAHGHIGATCYWGSLCKLPQFKASMLGSRMSFRMIVCLQPCARPALTWVKGSGIKIELPFIPL